MGLIERLSHLKILEERRQQRRVPVVEQGGRGRLAGGWVGSAAEAGKGGDGDHH